MVLKRLGRSAVTGAIGLLAVLWVFPILQGRCLPDAFGCKEAQAPWVYLIFASGGILILSALWIAAAFAFQFRRYLKEVDAERALEAAAHRELMREELGAMKKIIETAAEFLAKQPEEKDKNLTPMEFEAEVDMIFRRHSAEYLLRVFDEPERIVGWLMARINKERAIYLEPDPVSPTLGTVTTGQEQLLTRLLADDKTVALVSFVGQKQHGHLVNAKDMEDAIKEAGLPVWKNLLK